MIKEKLEYEAKFDGHNLNVLNKGRNIWKIDLGNCLNREGKWKENGANQCKLLPKKAGIPCIFLHPKDA